MDRPISDGIVNLDLTTKNCSYFPTWGHVEIFWPSDFQDLTIQDLRQPRFIDNCSKSPSPQPDKISNSKVPSHFKSIIGFGVLSRFLFLGFVGQVVISQFHFRVGQFLL